MATASIKTILKSAEQTCSETGARLTAKRRNVLETLLRSRRALSPYEIADCYKEYFDDSLPVMSIYRMLDFLAEENLVHKLSSINKFIACSHIACDHTHDVPQFMICDSCEDVSEIGIKKEIIDAIRASLKQVDFTLGTPQLELHGVCKSCSQLKA
ncbi:hypothetical protein NBRC116494_14640 [Aurantivibrio plasticivorans]